MKDGEQTGTGNSLTQKGLNSDGPPNSDCLFTESALGPGTKCKVLKRYGGMKKFTPGIDGS